MSRANKEITIIKTLALALGFTIISLGSDGIIANDFWLGADRTSWTQTESRKVKNDFGGNLVVTPDADWKEKWQTPPETIVYFNEASVVGIGDRLWILAFVVNPQLDKYGSANVTASLKATRPDSSVAFDLKDTPCLKGEMQGSLDNVRLCPAIVEFVGEPGDPLGEWVVEVTVTDQNRSTTLDLKSTFSLVSDGDA